MDNKNNKGSTFKLLKERQVIDMEVYYAFNHKQYSDLGPRTDADEVVGNLLIIDDL